MLVTGGAGTIGAAVVRRLTGDPDWEVRVSDQRDAPALQHLALDVLAALGVDRVGDVRVQLQPRPGRVAVRVTIAVTVAVAVGIGVSV